MASANAGRRLVAVAHRCRVAELGTVRGFWVGFTAVHLLFLVALAPVILGGSVLGDLPLYRFWGMSTLHGGAIPGVDIDWVYPLGALGPIALAGLLGSHWFQLCWLMMITALNATAAVAVLARGGRRSVAAAWWWLAIVLILSPVELLRLEGIVAPLGIVALVLLGRRPWAAATLLSAAAWIKIWPAAALAAMLTSARGRLPAALCAVGVSAAAVVTAASLGGLKHIASFLTAQTSRSLQLEAPVTTPWLWAEWMGTTGVRIYQNTEIATREVVGPGAARVASSMTSVMAVAVAAVLILVLLARRRGGDAMDLTLAATLAIVAALIVFNKVGSPQYVLWLVPVCVVGLAVGGREWRRICALVTAIAVMTTLIFPIYYLQLIELQLGALLLLSARNALLVTLLGLALLQLRAFAAPSAVPNQAAAVALQT